MSMHALAEAVADQALEVHDNLRAMSLDDVLAMRATIDRLVATLGLLRTDVDTRAMLLMERGQRRTLDGVGVFTSGWAGATRKTWDHERITKDIMAALLDASPAMGADEAIVRFLQVAHVDSYRLVHLLALGLNVDEYSQHTPGHTVLERTD